ncbi:hypothetical protein [Streptomyces iranensis]|uniref:Uncharacterized protein n=1 Tax=Streptomyces iranensis TaxID=576784 RepID=A0A060ZWF6_9ACTN|nr:hypothetical protein [Streptomyces iranensis]CDR10874.1 predicted protein [Streptomyces iranensis]
MADVIRGGGRGVPSSTPVGYRRADGGVTIGGRVTIGVRLDHPPAASSG